MKKNFCFLVMALLVEYNYGQTLAIASNTKHLSEHSSSLASLRAEGIKWTEGLSWREVKELAAQQKKYIFLDCFTTWCGPCKMMDERVYSSDSVGNYFNKHFVNVKVQLDQTNNDNQLVQSWYNDATAIAKQYRIEAFPSFVFLSPEGKLVHKAAGYIGISQFVAMGQIAVEPGKKYEDPYAEYDRLVADYKNGVVQYDRMYYMIKMALRVDNTLAHELTEKFETYILTLNDRQRLEKDAIGFLADKVLSGKSNEIVFFKKYEKKIDRIMQRKGFAASVIDKDIYYEIVVPFFNEQNKNPELPMTGMYLNGINPDYSEADWNKLEKRIRRKFNMSITDRNVLASRIEWYQRHWNIEASCRFKLIELEKYPQDIKRGSIQINTYSWNAFLYLTDNEILNGYIKWMAKLVQIYQYPMFLDTYANLLYKTGKKEEAIRWEEKAVETEKGASDGYKKVVEQMKRGEPTYGVKF
jgi:thioredoxin-related protein